MRQQYFILVLAHSLHGRLRRIQIPHRYLYAVLFLFLFSSVAMFGMISSYLRMTWKVSNYNSLRNEVESLREKYRTLQRQSDEKEHQLASLQLLASEVIMAYGLTTKLEGPPDISNEGALVPTWKQSLEEYDFLKSATVSTTARSSGFVRSALVHTMPMLWPVQGRLLSFYGKRTDPFSGEGASHTGLDISAGTGTPVHAAADGIIGRAEWSGRYGKLVVIDHGHGLQTWYAHLSRFEVLPGQDIRMGQVLGLSGGTGRVTSPHLHYEVRNGGNPVNPRSYMSASATPAETVHHRDLPF